MRADRVGAQPTAPEHDVLCPYERGEIEWIALFSPREVLPCGLLSRNMPTQTIYVRLLEDGTDVWRPVAATAVESDVFVIAPDNPVPDDERWGFQPGQRVRCRWRRFSNGEGYEAVGLAG